MHQYDTIDTKSQLAMISFWGKEAHSANSSAEVCDLKQVGRSGIDRMIVVWNGDYHKSTVHQEYNLSSYQIAELQEEYKTARSG